MNAIPATALGEAGSSNRSSQPDSADGEGVARSRSRRQRLFSDRRSARESKSFSIARRIAEKPLSRSNRSMSSTQSPPERFRKITARTIWMSSQPWPPAARTCRWIAPPRPQALISSRYKGSPASDKTRATRNVVQARSFAELLDQAVRKYQNRAIETAQVIEELIQLAKDMRAASARGEALKLSDDELAFYDALETNDSAVKVLGEPTLVKIARELVETVRKN